MILKTHFEVWKFSFRVGLTIFITLVKKGLHIDCFDSINNIEMQVIIKIVKLRFFCQTDFLSDSYGNRFKER